MGRCSTTRTSRGCWPSPPTGCGASRTWSGSPSVPTRPGRLSGRPGPGWSTPWSSTPGRPARWPPCSTHRARRRPGQTAVEASRSSRETTLPLLTGGAVALRRLRACWSGDSRPGSDGQGQFVERDGQSPGRRLFNGQLVVSAPNVLHQRMAGDDDPGTAVLFEPAHRPQSRLQPAVVALDAVIGVLVGAMPCRWQQRRQHRRVDRRPIGCDLDWSNPCGVDGLLEEPVGGVSVSSGGDEHVDDLAELVDRAVDIAPLAGDLHVGLINLPAIPHQVPAWPSGVGQQRREPLHPAVDANVVDLDAPLGEQLLDVAVGQAKAQVPADRDDDDIGWEPEASEVRLWNQSRTRTARSHAASLAAPRRSRRTQQRPSDSITKAMTSVGPTPPGRRPDRQRTWPQPAAPTPTTGARAGGEGSIG